MIALALRNWKLIVGGLGLFALGLLLMLAKADARHWRKMHDGVLASYQLEQAKHAITRQSVATLETALKAKNAESIARAEAFERAKAEAARDVASLNARWAAGEGARARLEAFVRNPPSAACRAPAGLISALEGL